MADITKTVSIIFGGKNELSSTLGEIGRDLDSLAGKPDKMNVSLSSVAKKVLEIDAGLASMVVGGMAYAIKSAGDFETSFDKVALRINASDSEIQKFKGDVLAYGADSTFSLGEINAALVESIQKGTSYTNAIGELSIAEKLAVATHGDLKSSTVLLSTVMNAYGASMSEATHYGDIFTKGVELGAGEIPQMADEMGKLSGIAAAMGIPIQTVVAAIAALGSYGIDTGTAIAGLKMMLNNLLAPSKEAQTEAAKLNIEFDAQAVKSKGLAAVLQETYTATNGNAEAMKALFGSVKGLNISMDLASDKQGIFKNDLVATQNATGEMQKKYDLFVDDFDNVNKRLKNSFTDTLVDIGLKLMPEYGKIAGALGDLMKGIKVGIDSGAFDPIFKYLDEVGKSVADWLAEVGKSFPDALKMVDFSGLVDALKDLGSAFGDMLKGTTSKDIADVIQTVVDSIVSLVRVAKGIGEVFVPIGEFIIEAVKAFNNLDDSTKSLIGNLLGFGAAYKMFGPLSIAMIALGMDTQDTAKIFAFFAAGLDNGVNLIKVALLGMALGFEKAVLAANQLLGLLPGYDNTEGIKKASANVATLSYELDLAVGKLFDSTEKIYALFDGTATSADKAKTSIKDVGAEAAKITGQKMLSIIATLDPAATDKTKFDIAQAFFQKDLTTIQLLVALGDKEAADAKAKLTSAFPERWNMDIEVLADGTTIETTKDMIYKQFGENSPGHEEGDYLITNIGTRADQEKMAATQKKIDDAFPKEKQIDIQAKRDEAKIKVDADTIQKAIEWKAKLDIANVEANTKIIEASFKSIDNTITSTGTTLSSFMGVLNESGGKGTTSFIEQQIEEEGRRRDATLAEQKLLLDAEIANIKARTEAMNRGDSIIKIDGTGLAPHLEAFMFAILTSIQIRVNQDYGDFLLGVK